MKRIVLILMALQSVLMVYAQNKQNREVYSQRIVQNDSLLLDTKLKDKERCVYLVENNNNKDSIIILLDSKISDLENKLDVCEQQLINNKQELKVKDFFLCSDTTVFGSRFIELDIAEYPFYMREYYQLVCDLRDVNHKLISIEEFVKDINTNELTADLPKKSKQTILQEKTKTQILELREQLLKFKERDMNYLSEEQTRFFEEYLKPKYNNLIDVIYNESNNQE